ncbi:MAG: hypothetical protein ACYCWW_01580 [Deltaproteobacteria bacterium]
MARLLLVGAGCLVLLPVEAALLHFLPWLGGARADLCLCGVVWLATSDAGADIGPIAGLVGAYLCGTIADLFYAVHPGLFALLSVILFLAIRIGPADARSRSELGLLTFAVALVEALLARGLLALVGQPLPQNSAVAVLGGAVLTGLCAIPFSFSLELAARAFEREDSSLLR